MKPPTPYPELNAVLSALLEQTRDILGQNFVGLYLQGSFGLGDFDQDSDVDFLVVTDTDMTGPQESALQVMHAQIYDLESAWARHLEGSYITRNALSRFENAGEALLYLDNTARDLIRSNHCNTLVVRWTLREFGIALAGPEPKTLLGPVLPDAIRQEVAMVMREWGAELLGQPERVENRWYQAFAVLSYCRMLQTLETGTVTSKPAAAAWARTALDRRWTGLIERAWAERPNPSLKVRQLSDRQDFRDTLEFIRYAIGATEQFTAGRKSSSGEGGFS